MKVKPSVAKEILRAAIRNRHPVLMVGPPGCGKTDINTQVTTEEDVILKTMHPAVSEPTEFRGQPIVVDGQAKFLPYDEVRFLIEATKPTVCFFDDFGHASPSTQSATMHLLLARSIGEFKVSDYVTFFAATNLRKHRAGVTSLIEPVKSRFATIIELQQDLDEWITWAHANSVPMEFIALIRYRPQLLLGDWQPAEDDANSLSPRTIAHAAVWFNMKLSKGATHAAIVGAAGEGFATELFGFLDFWEKLPDPDEILAHPGSTPLPTVRDGMGIIYALCGALAQRARRNTARAICTVANLLPPEFAVAMMNDCAAIGGKEFVETTNYAQWESAHHNLRV